MPGTVNGIGTWYYGKENVHRHMDACDNCGAFGEQQSYDTTLYFVVVFVPVLPLGKYRVIDECPSCRVHRSAKLHQWRAAREAAIETVMGELSGDPHNTEKVKQAIGTLVTYEDEESFNQIAAGLREHMKDNAEVQALLGKAFVYFSRNDEAEAAFRDSLAAADSADVKGDLAMSLIRQGRTAEARPLLQHVLDEKKEDDVGLLYLMIEGYQAEGRHSEALALMDDIAGTLADLADDPEIAKYRKVSEKNLSSGRPIRSVLLSVARTDDGSGHSTGAFAAKIIPKILLAFLLVGLPFLYVVESLRQAGGRQVHLVSGLSEPCRIEIAGRSVDLPPTGHKAVTIPEGEHDVRVTDAEGNGIGIPQERVTVRTPFLTRPFAEKTFVINPDRMAVVIWEQTVYAAKAGPKDKQNEFKINVGEVLYEFDGVDYHFVDFPKQIELPSESARVPKERIFLLEGFQALGGLGIIHDQVGPEACRRFVKRVIARDANAEMHLQLLRRHLGDGKYIEFMKPCLAERPLLVNWHRAYQIAVEATRPEHDLAAEYRKIIDAEGETPDGLYLLARVTVDPEESERLNQKAAKAAGPSAYALNSLAYARLSNGRFEESLEFARKALAILPGRTIFEHVEGASLRALRRHAEALKLLRAQGATGSGLDVITAEELGLLVATGQEDAARKRIAASCAALAKRGAPPEFVTQYRNSIHAVLHYQSGREKEAAGLFAKADDAGGRASGLLSTGRTAEAAKLLEGDAEVPFRWHLLVYIAAASGGDDETAAKHLGLAVGKMRKGGQQAREFAEYLAGERTPEVDRALGLVVHPEEKRVLIAAMGVRYPRDRGKYFDLARKLNFDIHFPHLLLKRILGSPGQGSRPVDGGAKADGREDRLRRCAAARRGAA